MNIDIMDSITELETTQKKAKAVLDSFMHEFTEGDTRTCKLAIDANPDQFQYMAHVIADLMYQAICQAKELSEMAEAEMQKVG